MVRKPARGRRLLFGLCTERRDRRQQPVVTLLDPPALAAALVPLPVAIFGVPVGAAPAEAPQPDPIVVLPLTLPLPVVIEVWGAFWMPPLRLPAGPGAMPVPPGPGLPVVADAPLPVETDAPPEPAAAALPPEPDAPALEPPLLWAKASVLETNSMALKRESDVFMARSRNRVTPASRQRSRGAGVPA